MNSEKKFAFVQALRGIAALWVVFFHASEGHHIEFIRAATPAWLYGLIFDAGHYGVAIFFALSGFVIAHSIRGAAISPSFLGRFALRRSLRLDPPYWMSIALVVAMGQLSTLLTEKPHALPTLHQLLAHLVYIQEIARIPEIATVYWTLTYEVQFYIVLVGSLVISRFSPIVLFALAISSTLGYHPNVPGLFTNLWPAFFVGTLAYWAKSSGKYLTMMLVLATIMFWTKNNFLIISSATALTLFAFFRAGLLGHALNVGPLQKLGMISYSLYLTHNSITGAIANVAHRFLGSSIAADLAVLVLILALCILFAFAFYRIIERPTQTLSSKLFGTVRIVTIDTLPPDKSTKISRVSPEA